MAPTSKKSKNKPSDEASKLNKSSKKPFKPENAKKSRKEKIESEAVPLGLEDDEPSFPRGGGSALSRREREEVREQAEADFEADEKRSLKQKQKLKRKPKPRKGLQSGTDNHHEDDDFGSLFGSGVEAKLRRYANKITSKNISCGMKLWGVVAEVNERDLVVSLPGGLRGLVRASDAMDPVDGNTESLPEGTLSSIFYVGQLVACVVVHLDNDNRENGKRKIWLSLRLSLLHKGFSLDSILEGMVLTAYVRSIEDHGCILHFGLSAFTGFLPKTSHSGAEITIGQLLQGVVKKIDKTRKVVYLGSNPDTVSKHVTKEVQGISIDILIPGMMVTATVQSTLENGVMLSFLRVFTGTVDIFHLQNSLASNWQEDYGKNKKVNARILFIDPSSGAIGLTLNPHLVQNKSPPSHAKIGDIYDDAKVVRVDKGLGLLLEIPSIPDPTPAYVIKSEVAEEQFQKLEKKFKNGVSIRVRILGFRNLEGVATGTSKADAFEGSVFTHSDAIPGMVVKAKVIAVDPFGAIVQFPGGIKAKCPLPHMSELEIFKPGKDFKVGAELVFRVLGGKSKRITVTYKKTLVKSKLTIISSYVEATDGLLTHGWITKIEKHGCFVRFYNGVQGFAPRSELEIEPGRDPSSVYHVGQVIKCRVLSCIPGARRINLSFIITPPRIAEDDIIKVGSLVSGVAEIITENAVIVYVNGKKHLKGTIPAEHLADHRGQAALIKSTIKPGCEFDQLLLLDTESNNMIFSAKYSLIKSAGQLPSELSQIRPNSIVHGYVCNIIESGCFVRFLGRLTGFSPRSKAVDDSKIDLSEAFYIGQSVRSNVVDVNNETGRITISLKQSSCSSTDASFIQDYFRLEGKIAEMQSPDSDDWTKGFNVGCAIKGKIQEVKDIGVVVSFDKYKDALGFITRYQLGGKDVQADSPIKAVVLDVSKTDHLVDLSLKPEFIDKSKEERSHKNNTKKRKIEASVGLEVHQTVNATVEIVKENYLVVSLPENNHAVGYISTLDYNCQKVPEKQFQTGQRVVATVMALPDPSTMGRLLLLLKSVDLNASSLKRAKKKFGYKVGSLVEAEISDIRPLDLRVKFGAGLQGRVHITEVDTDNTPENPFSNFRVGQVVHAKIVGIGNNADSNKNRGQFDLSLRSSMLKDSFEIDGMGATEELEFSTGQYVGGYVYKVDSEWVWLTISRNLRAQLFILDSSREPSELNEFQKRFHVGQYLPGHVLSVNKDKKLLRLVLNPFSKDGQEASLENGNLVAPHISDGCLLGGRVSRILPGVGGLTVQIGPHMYGRVHYVDLADSLESDPLSRYHQGQFVKCKVVEVNKSVSGSLQVDLSLRGLDNEAGSNEHAPIKFVEKIEDLHPDMLVQGYVKSITPKGCFIMLSRKLDARIILSNLSDGFVKDPETEFPIGKLITGRVISVEPLSKRIEVTLKTNGAGKAATSEKYDISSLHVGDIVSGKVKRVESYGLFISMDNTNAVGLCHKSELADDRIDDIGSKYKAGERVRAKILKVDAVRNRIALGFKDLNGIDDPSGEDDVSDVESHSTADDTDLEPESLEDPLAQAESRSFVPPLEVVLDEADQEDLVNLVNQNQELTEGDAIDEKTKKHADRKAKKEREKQIKAAEDRLLEQDIPRTSEEFEKRVRVSPNSSFVWIKYMEFALTTADVEKARSIAERALQTINIREENEKLNIWVAYLNLENQFGQPPEEAVQKVFQRALQCSDPEQVYMALLDVYEKSNKNELADELVMKMSKKFKQSCQVWLKQVQRALKQQHNSIQPIVNRALLSLPKLKHIEFLSQSAILEFKCGVPHRGRSMFEEILKGYPKRMDLWNIYLDQEIKLGDDEVIRALFERATSLRLHAKKMKFLFKKYLEFEKSRGDEERVEYVKRKAMEYVESSLAS